MWITGNFSHVLKKTESSFSEMIKEGRIGYGQNATKYFVKDGSTKDFTAKDVARVENTLNEVQKLKEKIQEQRNCLISYRSNLFNKEVQIKQWKA